MAYLPDLKRLLTIDSAMCIPWRYSDLDDQVSCVEGERHYGELWSILRSADSDVGVETRPADIQHRFYVSITYIGKWTIESPTILLPIIRFIDDVVVIDEEVEGVIQDGNSEIVVIRHKMLVIAFLAA